MSDIEHPGRRPAQTPHERPATDRVEEGGSIQFFFDFVSPYSYLAWTQIGRLATEQGMTVHPSPALLAGILRAHGTRGPAEVPARREYLIKDVIRIAEQFGVPFDLPPAHPFNPLLALRVSLQVESYAQRGALVDALFHAAWVDGQDLSDHRVVASALDLVGLSPEMIGQAQTDEWKRRLHAQTDLAVSLGVFGVPTMVTGTELFFGCDSLPHLGRLLRGESSLPLELVERWRRLPVGSQRRSAADGG